MDRDLAALSRLTVAEPPPALDALVRERMQAALARACRGGAYPANASEAPAACSTRPGTPIAVPLPERCLYAVSLVVCGVQAVGVVARLVWRTFTG